MPSEPELASSRNVSRQTARTALQLLEQEGLVTVRARRGRIVRSHQRLRWNLSSFEHPGTGTTATSGADAWETDVESQGHDPTRQDLTVERITPPKDIATLLDLDPTEDTCVVRRRVRYIDGEPAIISDDYFDLRIVEGTELAEPEDTTARPEHADHGRRARGASAVIRVSLLVQGGAWRRRAALGLMQPQALARGVRPPAGPRAARGCGLGRASGRRYAWEQEARLV
ncbi:MAG: GntR family transcriptional regulator [Acidobacteria bacterium]|nr:GntR family transcriptional regulator [Acidobacteriota bacterium]